MSKYKLLAENNFFNPFMLVTAITAGIFLCDFSNKSNFQKLFEGEMFFRTVFTTLL